MKEIDLTTSGYMLSYCRDFVKEKLENYDLKKRHIKHQLFDETSCF